MKKASQKKKATAISSMQEKQDTIKFLEKDTSIMRSRSTPKNSHHLLREKLRKQAAK
ncbi:hypothetical protein HRED_08975 [Candidatus Haloredivivus sp. G17]|nr:hypothetical protein HRED_08975 [Candidatus Haloredivivus sp. G17]